jgi:hypothetical protein
MYRASVHRWIAALALVATLGLMAAQPAAAADLRAADRLASLWSAVTARPAALWERLTGWLGGTEKPSPQQKNGWGIDPLGNPTLSGSNGAPADGSK